MEGEGLTKENLAFLDESSRKKSRDGGNLIAEWKWAYGHSTDTDHPKKETLGDEIFNFVSVQHYCTKGRRNKKSPSLIPAEMTILEFSLAQGVLGSKHWIFSVNPTLLSSEELRECEERRRDVHGLLREGSGEEAYTEAYQALRDIMKKRRFLFSLEKEAVDVYSAIKYITSQIGKRSVFSNKQDQVIWMETLIKTAMEWRYGETQIRPGGKSWKDFLLESLDLGEIVSRKELGWVMNLCETHKRMDPGKFACSSALAVRSVELITHWFLTGEFGSRPEGLTRDNLEEMPEWDFEREPGALEGSPLHGEDLIREEELLQLQSVSHDEESCDELVDVDTTPFSSHSDEHPEEQEENQERAVLSDEGRRGDMGDEDAARIKTEKAKEESLREAYRLLAEEGEETPDGRKRVEEGGGTEEKEAHVDTRKDKDGGGGTGEMGTGLSVKDGDGTKDGGWEMAIGEKVQAALKAEKKAAEMKQKAGGKSEKSEGVMKEVKPGMKVGWGIIRGRRTRLFFRSHKDASELERMNKDAVGFRRFREGVHWL